MSITGEFNGLCMMREYGLGIREGLDDFPCMHFVVNKIECARDDIYFLILTLDICFSLMLNLLKPSAKAKTCDLDF